MTVPAIRFRNCFQKIGRWSRNWAARQRAQVKTRECAENSTASDARCATGPDRGESVFRKLRKYWPLVNRLGDTSFQVRQNAARKRIEAGWDALPIVRMAKDHEQAEISRVRAPFIETQIIVFGLLEELSQESAQRRRSALRRLSDLVADPDRGGQTENLLLGVLEEVVPHVRGLINNILKNAAPPDQSIVIAPPASLTNT